MSNPKWDPEKKLDFYIYHYLLKKNFIDSAMAFKAETNVSTEDDRASTEPGILLPDWWSVFWETYLMRSNQIQQRKAQEVRKQLMQELRNTNQNQQIPTEPILQRYALQQQSLGGAQHVSGSASSPVNSDPLMRRNQATSHTMETIRDDYMPKLLLQGDALDDAAIKQKVNVHPLLDSKASLLKEITEKTAGEDPGQRLCSAAAILQGNIPQAQNLNPNLPGSTQDIMSFLNAMRRSPPVVPGGSFIGSHGFNQGGSNLTLKEFPLANDLTQLLQSYKSPYIEHHRMRLEQENLVSPSPSNFESTSHRMLLDQIMGPGKDELSNSNDLMQHLQSYKSPYIEHHRMRLEQENPSNFESTSHRMLLDQIMGTGKDELSNSNDLMQLLQSYKSPYIEHHRMQLEQESLFSPSLSDFESSHRTLLNQIMGLGKDDLSNSQQVQKSSQQLQQYSKESHHLSNQQSKSLQQQEEIGPRSMAVDGNVSSTLQGNVQQQVQKSSQQLQQYSKESHHLSNQQSESLQQQEEIGPQSMAVDGNVSSTLQGNVQQQVQKSSQQLQQYSKESHHLSNQQSESLQKQEEIGPGSMAVDGNVSSTLQGNVQKQVQKSSQQLQQYSKESHHLSNQQSESLQKQEEIGPGSMAVDGNVSSTLQGNVQASKSQTRKGNLASSSCPADRCSGTSGPSSIPRTPKPGDVMAVSTLQQKQKADMDPLLGDGSSGDNVESYLSPDGASPRDKVGKGDSLKEKMHIKASLHKVECCHFSSDGKLFATGGHDNKASLWSMQSLGLKSTLDGHTECITDVRFSPSTLRVATSSADKFVKVWDVDNPSHSPRTFMGHTTAVLSVDFHPNKEDIICSCDSSDIRYWSINKGGCAGVFRVNQGGATQMRFQPYFGRIVAAAVDDHISVCDIETMRRADLKGHDDVVRCVCWDLSGKYIASLSDNKVKIWALGNKECIHELHASRNKFKTCVFHPSRPVLIIGRNKILQLWDYSQNKRVTTIYAHDDVVSSLAVSKAAGLLASTSGMHAKIWIC